MTPSPSRRELGSRRLLARGLVLFAVALSATAGIADRLRDALAQDDGFTARAGVVIAALIMGMVTFGLGLLNVPGIVMSIFVGLLLIVVIALPILWRRVFARRAA